MNVTDDWGSRVVAYLEYRRSFGFELAIDGKQLESFARFADQRGARHLTPSLAADWARDSTRASEIGWARRIETLRGFARFHMRTDPDTVIPPRNLLGRGHRRLVPHIFTELEIRMLLSEAKLLGPAGGLRAPTCCVLFGLLATTGLRISEALHLTDADVDLQAGVLDIRDSKFHQRRYVAMHATVSRQLLEYIDLRDQIISSRRSDRFFLRDDGQRVTQRQALYALRAICERRLGWKPRGDYRHHRLHDLRHTFIVHSALRFYREEADIERCLSALSIYVGHAKVVDTYWYFTGIPELMAIAADRFERYAEGVPA
ncbi:tyrosine-type recombinase/integrase [Paraburkholderia youngii]|uniref:Tyrosine-type recombinase/integrase n=1 Tax=Paraburkholderia youngii TaxID=2782701 RepID=A0A7Y6K990_9BURK|nr:tyrosine-type recombinase/integrase [Paraburkholderia youngii]NUY06179.1 tyrosine-type recombinase/integrase [Paraburkholderia youngii]